MVLPGGIIMDFCLSDQQLSFIQAAKDYAVGELAPNAAQWDAQCVFPRQAFAQAGALGFCAIFRRFRHKSTG
jgi:alkylation response protein AidB-like acyl-CoA dehydrogenase